MLIRRRFIHKN